MGLRVSSDFVGLSEAALGLGALGLGPWPNLETQFAKCSGYEGI